MNTPPQFAIVVMSVAFLGFAGACDPQSIDTFRGPEFAVPDTVYSANNRADIALTGVTGWTTIPLARSNGDGNFMVTNAAVGDFAAWSSMGRSSVLHGDFNADGLADIALTGVLGWTTIPVAFSIGNGTFKITNKPVANFPIWAATNATKLAGDFDGDGRMDIALTGAAGWGSIPVAFSRGHGNFNVTNRAISNFPTWAVVAPTRLAGDFDGDGRTDIALMGVSGWNTIPIAFSTGNGAFTIRNKVVPDFPARTTAGATKLVGDFNGDGRTDIALTGVTGWTTIPLATSNGNGTFSVTNKNVADFAAWSGASATKLVGDFDGDGRTDIALTGVVGWGSIPIAFSNGDGTFYITNETQLEFAGWAASDAAKLVGDFNGDGRADIVLTGATGWNSIPVAFSNGDGSFDVTNQTVAAFPAWAATEGAQKLVGRFD